jgi:hypothetical protein
MPTSPIVLFFLILTLAICLLAFWKGGSAERIGAAVILVNLLVSVADQYLVPETLRPVTQLVVDGLTALGLLVVAVRYASFWVGGVMLLYGIQFTLHSFYFVTDRPNDLLHAVVNNLDFLGVSVCLGIGTLIAWRRRARAAIAAA